MGHFVHAEYRRRRRGHDRLGRQLEGREVYQDRGGGRLQENDQSHVAGQHEYADHELGYESGNEPVSIVARHEQYCERLDDEQLAVRVRE